MVETYFLRLTGPGIDVGRTVDEGTALRVVSLAMSSRVMGSSKSSTDQLQSHGLESTTVAEFLAQTSASNNAERIAAIALYLRDHLKREALPREEVLLWFQKAGLQPPRNVSRDVTKAIQAGLIIEGHPGDRYQVTRSGKERILPVRKGGAAKSKVEEQPTELYTTENAPQDRSDRGPIDKIRRLIYEGWFKSPRTAKDIREKLEASGYSYRRTDLTRQLKSLAERGELEREKQPDVGTNRKIWHYTATRNDLFSEKR